ncbi:MAG: acetate kinase [Candidatus Nomurabacteria bacterium]|jgi:acetate kinase|nr:acetate kinase [Candidatus Nomurabacteria bacterium]
MDKENILVINSGSSSVKFQLIDAETEETIVKGMAEKLGLDDAHIKIGFDGQTTDQTLGATATHTDAIRVLFEFLDANGLSETILAVGHRVVHGGEKFTESVLITPEVIEQIEEVTPFAPLHNPANLRGVEAIAKIDDKLPQVAVFDTAFHSTMPPEAYRYSVPSDWYHKYGVRRYGFHGISYDFITKKTAKILGKKPSEVNLVIAHIGSGTSIAAIKNGESVSTTMGFTPLAGLPMGTRSGNIDPGVIPYIMEKEDLTATEVVDQLNKKGGHKAIATVSDDVRDILVAMAKGDENAKLALDIFTRKCAKYIGGFMTMLPSLDALVFTAGIGENGWETREAIVDRLAILGFKIDKAVNRKTIGFEGKEGLVSAKSSKYPIYALGTDEAVMIARDTAKATRQK